MLSKDIRIKIILMNSWFSLVQTLEPLSDGKALTYPLLIQNFWVEF